MATTPVPAKEKKKKLSISNKLVVVNDLKQFLEKKKWERAATQAKMGRVSENLHLNISDNATKTFPSGDIKVETTQNRKMTATAVYCRAETQNL